MRELIIDSFAGGGGASDGIRLALGRSPDIAINHDPAALAMHAANHPETLHLPHNVWKVSLRDLVGARPIGLLWMSPDCRHHSKAKGGAPVSPSVRDLAWVALRWLRELRPWQRPRRIFLENVEEFRKWCPLIPDGKGGMKPDPDREGETFLRWVRELRKMGYRRVEWRELRACDYGTPTIRRRLYLIAARDGEPIVWPEPTHGDPASPAVRSGERKPWPVAADIIEWNRPCPSIFMTREEARAYTAATGVRLVRPLAPKTEARIAKGVKRYVVDAATRARDAHGLVVPHVMIMRNADKPHAPADAPVHTITAGGAGLAVVEGMIAPFLSYGQQGGASRAATDPHHTVTASRKDTNGVVAAYLAQHNDNRIGQPAESPAPTVTTRGTQTHVVAANLVQHNTDMVGHDMREPLSTIVGSGSTQGVVATHMLSLKGSDRRAGDVGVPHPAVCAGGQHSAVVTLPLMTAYYSTGGQHAGVDEPMLTVPTHARFGLVECDAAAQPAAGDRLGQARQVAEFLRRHGCWDGGDLVTVGIAGETFVVVDIGMRMLTARELARAQGFPDSYVLAAPHGDGVLSDTEQRHKIGNSVCRQVAAALVAANYQARDVLPDACADFVLQAAE